jgi:hypothetical protein
MLLAAMISAGCQAMPVPAPPAVHPAAEGSTSSALTPGAQPPVASPDAPQAVASATRLTSFDVDVTPVVAGPGAFTIQIFDAVTARRLPTAGAPVADAATIVTPDGRDLVTDEQGQVRIDLAGVAPGTPLLFVALRGKQRLEAFHLFDATAPAAAYQALQAQALRLRLDAASTVGARILQGIAQLSGTLLPALRETHLITAIQQLNELGEAIGDEVAAQPDLVLEFTIDPQSPADVEKMREALKDLLGEAGVASEIDAFVAAAVRSITRDAEDPANREAGATLPERVVLEGTDLVVEVEPATGDLDLEKVDTDSGSSSRRQPPTTADVTLR